jgi:hypothetical protein
MLDKGIVFIIHYGFIMLLAIYIGSKISVRRVYWMLNSISYDQNYLKDFKYKGKSIEVKVLEENITPRTFDYEGNSITSMLVYINDNPVLDLWITQTPFKKINMIINNEYNTKDLFKILKTYRKACRHAFC